MVHLRTPFALNTNNSFPSKYSGDFLRPALIAKNDNFNYKEWNFIRCVYYRRSPERAALWNCISFREIEICSTHCGDRYERSMSSVSVCVHFGARFGRFVGHERAAAAGVGIESITKSRTDRVQLI